MPLKSKKPVPKKKKPSPKAKWAKPKLVAKPKLEAKSSPKKKSAKSPPKSIFWQILEERKKQREHAPPQPFKSDHRGPHPQQSRHEQFAKFAGPRRRAA